MLLGLSSQLKVYRETGNPLGLFDVKQKLDEFVWQPGDNPNYGFSEKGVWLHTTISNVTENKQWVIDVAFTQLEKVDIYVLLDDEILDHISHGKLHPHPEYRFPTLKLDMPYAQTIDLFVRIESQQSALVAPVDIQTHSTTNKLISMTILYGVYFMAGLLCWPYTT